MPRHTTIFDLLISCPGDIVNEIASINSAVDEFNRYSGTINNVSIQTRHWIKDSFPQSGGKPQSLINQQFVNDCDATIALFWTRFGTPTDKYQSGTEEEMIKSGKQVFLYFCDKPITPSSVNHKQYEKIIDFKNKYKGLYSTYTTTEEFEKIFFNHLFLYFIKQITVNKHEIPNKTRFDDDIKAKKSFNILSDYYEYETIKPVVSYGSQKDINIIQNKKSFEMVLDIKDCSIFGQQEFVMALLKYSPSEDMSAFWRNNYSFEFDIISSLGIHAIQLEIKDENHNKLVDKRIPCSQTQIHHKFLLSKLTRKHIVWEKVNEICFVIFLNENYISKTEGKLIISNLQIKMN